MTIEIPPLRERREDIPLLAEKFAVAAAEKFGVPVRPIAQSALRRLVDYNWPGNVRELKNTMDRAVILAEGSELTARDLLTRAHPNYIQRTRVTVTRRAD